MFGVVLEAKDVLTLLWHFNTNGSFIDALTLWFVFDQEFVAGVPMQAGFTEEVSFSVTVLDVQ